MYQTMIKGLAVGAIICASMMVVFAGVAYCASVTLAWDHNTPLPWENTEQTKDGGYRIFHRIEGGAYDYEQPAWEGRTNTGTIDNLADDTTHYFVVRAWADQQESADSIEVQFIATNYRPLPGVAGFLIKTIIIPIP